LEYQTLGVQATCVV